MGMDMVSNGLTDRSILGHRRSIPRSDAKNDNQDWLASEIAKKSVDERVRSTGMTDKAVQNIRQRRSKISFDNLVDLCRDDPEFAAAFAAHIGLILPGEAEYIGALNKTMVAYQRMKATRGGE
jgi:hypothetical protein